MQCLKNYPNISVSYISNILQQKCHSDYMTVQVKTSSTHRTVLKSMYFHSFHCLELIVLHKKVKT